ncbi:MAG TPA: hypothetical protein VGU71_22340 [Candidatus Dormibacteraeota bacterium]|nr:hypothetical protein [Candidatus Dormibacteraeota bacterium]
MPTLFQPGLTDDSGSVTSIGPTDLEGYSDSLIVPGLLFPLQQLTITIVVGYINGGASPSITFSIDQLTGDGPTQKWTSIWSSGAISAPGTTGPTIVNPPGGANAFDPPVLRLSWVTTGQPTQVDFTPNLQAA